MKELPKRLVDQIVQSTVEFFKTNGAQSVTVDQSLKGDYQWTAIIGLAGDMITGSLAITCRQELLDKTHPNHALGMPVNPEDLVDWLGEISNQVLGRLKNFTLDYGMGFSLAAPSVVKGQVLEVQDQGKKLVKRVTFNVDSQPLVVAFVANIKDGFDYDKAEQIKKEGKAAEGDAFLF